MNETPLETAEGYQAKRNPLLWPIRLLLYWIVKAVVVVFLLIRFILRPRAVRYGLIALMIVGFVGWQLWGQTLANQGVALAGSQSTLQSASMGVKVSMPSAEQLSPSPVVERYLSAQAAFDARGMWEVISDDLKQQLAASNTSVNDLQVELNAAKDSGRKYGQATYVAGSSLDEGARAYFYVLTIETGSGTMKVPYVYVVSGDGKIASIQ